MNAHTPIRVALIGYGYWGPNLARNLQESALFELVGICDQSENQRALIKRRFPSIQVFEEVSDILNDDQIDAIVIATPPSTHFSIAMQGLKAGKHVLVEKPITLDSQEAIQLIHTAKLQSLQLMVDHTFVYSPPVQYLYESIAKNDLGSLHAFDSTRINLGLIQKDTNLAFISRQPFRKWNLARWFGSVNSHCHLSFSYLIASVISTRGRSFQLTSQ